MDSYSLSLSLTLSHPPPLQSPSVPLSHTLTLLGPKYKIHPITFLLSPFSNICRISGFNQELFSEVLGFSWVLDSPYLTSIHSFLQRHILELLILCNFSFVSVGDSHYLVWVNPECCWLYSLVNWLTLHKKWDYQKLMRPTSPISMHNPHSTC